MYAEWIRFKGNGLDLWVKDYMYGEWIRFKGNGLDLWVKDYMYDSFNTCSLLI